MGSLPPPPPPSLRSLLILLHLFFFTTVAHSLLSNSLQQHHQQQHLCHEDERSALLQFKQSFVLKKKASRGTSAYPKVLSWNVVEEGDCCSWDGIECDDHTGHVIGLDLSSSFLYGSINSNSTIFSHFVHLQALNLADNHFNYSQIPSAVGHLWRLTTLNLSMSVFYGEIPPEIPPEISQLSILSSLDLSLNVNPLNSDEGLLHIQKPILGQMVRNITKIQKLHLGTVNIYSMLPTAMANLSLLTNLHLRQCGIYGEFPIGIFSLPSLRFLTVPFNQNLTGYFHHGSLLEEIYLGRTSFFGKLPDSIGNLKYLKLLDIGGCNFSGPIPSSVGNLINLETFDLSGNHFIGQIPSSLMNLTRLHILSIYDNQFTGQIPSSLGNLTELTDISLTSNAFHGPIPQSMFNLKNLKNLDLKENNLSGTMELDRFLELKNLISLTLGDNNLSLYTTGRTQCYSSQV